VGKRSARCVYVCVCECVRMCSFALCVCASICVCVCVSVSMSVSVSVSIYSVDRATDTIYVSKMSDVCLRHVSESASMSET